MLLISGCDMVYTDNSLIPLCDLAMFLGRPHLVFFVSALLDIVLPDEIGEQQDKDQTFGQTFPPESDLQGVSGH
jgi:hypothetical protein